MKVSLHELASVRMTDKSRSILSTVFPSFGGNRSHTFEDISQEAILRRVAFDRHAYTGAGFGYPHVSPLGVSLHCY